MKDLTDPFWIKLKGLLFLVLGLLSAALIVARHPDLQTAVLLGVAIWAFCRAYYFAFYVIGKYVDSSYRFSGLGSFVIHLIRARRKPDSAQNHATSETTDDMPPS